MQKNPKIVAFDTETDGLDIIDAKPFLFVLYDGTDFLTTRNPEDVREILENPKIPKIMHNAKFDTHMMRNVGIKIQGRIYCTMLAAHLLDENKSSSLEAVAKRYLNEEKQSDAVSDWFISQGITNKDDKKYNLVPDNIIVPYAEMDTKLTFDLLKAFFEMLRQENLLGVYKQECDLIDVVIDMERRGMRIDLDYFENLFFDSQNKMIDIKEKIYNVVGYAFDIESGKQLATIFKSFGIELPKTPKGNDRTSKDIVEEIDHELAKLILEYRHLQKLSVTYAKSYLDKNKDGIIHSNFLQNGTVTGRCSCTNPNLQNIPKKDKTIRTGFIPRPGYVNVHIDYKQMEYRVFADYANAQNLIDDINAGKDFHQVVADTVGIDRDRAKTLNFGLLYGMGFNKMAKSLNLPPMDAQRVRQNYFKAFPMAKSLMNEVKAASERRGYIFNKFGRRRRLTSDKGYKAVNALVQGCCADVIKKAMIDVHKFIQNKDINLLMQIHDELFIECKKNQLHYIQDIIDIMQNFDYLFKVKLEVDCEMSTKNWANKEKFSIDGI